MKSPVKIGAIFDSLSTRKDKSFKLVFETNELSHAEAANLFELRDQHGWLIFAPFETQEVEIPSEPPSDFEANKSQSQRLRAVLYVLWSQGKKEFSWEEFYRTKMESIINKIKDRLEPSSNHS